MKRMLIAALLALLITLTQNAMAFVFFLPDGGLSADTTLTPVRWRQDTVTFGTNFQQTLPAGVLVPSDFQAGFDRVLKKYNDLSLTITLVSAFQQTPLDIANNVRFNVDKFCAGCEWGDAVGITQQWFSGSGVMSKVDIFFKEDENWVIAEGGCVGFSSLNFTCVAMHEVGHALGLGHPDELGQTVQAIMNSTLSADLDSTFRTDDLEGVNFLYPFGRPINNDPVKVKSAKPAVGSGALGGFGLFALFVFWLLKRFTKSGLHGTKKLSSGSIARSFLLKS